MASSQAANTTTFQATCHCRTFNQTFTLPTSAFPLKSALCHCTSCRHATGQLFVTFAVIPGPLPSSSMLTSLVLYESSPGLKRYFCPVCGASCLNVDERDGEWELCTGTMEFGDEKELEGRLNRVLLWVSDTIDGGAVHWLGEGRPESFGGRHLEGRDSLSVTDVVIEEMLAKGKEMTEKGEVLKGSCHCGDVKVELLRADDVESERDTSAELCCCNSCRKCSGFEINAWVHWPKGKVRMADGSPYEEGMKSIGHYVSSKDTHRYFCKRCGAMVFFDMPHLKRLDIGLGIFDAPEGSRADNWFTWNPDKEDVSYIEDAVDKDFVGKLANGVGASTRAPGVERASE